MGFGGAFAEAQRGQGEPATVAAGQSETEAQTARRPEDPVSPVFPKGGGENLSPIFKTALFHQSIPRYENSTFKIFGSYHFTAVDLVFDRGYER